jgi:hypothetical protein
MAGVKTQSRECVASAWEARASSGCRGFGLRLKPACTALLSALFLLLSASPARLTGQDSAQNPPAQAQINPKAQELLDRCIRALGGPAFLSFKTMTATGRIYAISDESTAGLEAFVSAVEYPDKRRFSYGKEKPVILINNGERAWEVDRMGVTHQLPEQIRRWKLSTHYSLENLLRLHIHEPGVLVLEGGVDFVDNVPTRVVDVIEAGGAQARLYLNQQTFLPVRIDYRARNPQTGEWDDFSDVYGDYQRIQGIQTPMHIARFLNDERISEMFRRTARYNDAYPANYFEPAS